MFNIYSGWKAIKAQVWCAFLAILFIFISSGYAFAFVSNQETSVVSLTVTSNNAVIDKQINFELLDLGDYVLLPVNQLSAILELEIDFQRDRNIVMISSKRFERKAAVDLNHALYIVEAEGTWQEPPPVVLNSDFYMSPQIIEYLANVKISWESKYQELTIDGDWIPSKKNLLTVNSHQTNGSIPQAPDLESKPIEGPACSIGTIEYKLVTESRKDGVSGNQTQNGVLSLRSVGRAGPWTIATGTDIGYDPLQDGPYSELTLIRGKYEDQDKIIILGDSGLILDRTLGVKDLRGVLYQTPEQQYQTRLFAFTTVSGDAVPGDKVKLIVNGELVREFSVGDQYSYVFADVALRLRRINIIKVIIEKSNGQWVEDTKRIGAFPRLLVKGDGGYLLAYGDFRQPGMEYWEGRALAVKMNCGLTDWTTFNCEITRTETYDPFGINHTITSCGDLGFAFRAGQGLLYTVDWLVSGGESGVPLESGWETSLLNEMENGVFEMTVFYIPDNLTKGLRQTNSGRGLKVLDEIELSPYKTLTISGIVSGPIPEDPAQYAGEYGLKYSETSNKDIRIVKSMALQKNTSQNSFHLEDQLELISEYSLKKKDWTVQSNLHLVNLDITGTDETLNLKTASLDCSLIKKIGKSLLLGVNVSPVESWFDDVNYQYNFLAEAQLKWNSKHTWISVAGSIDGENKFGEDGQFKITRQKLAGTISYFLMNNMNTNYRYEYIMDQLNNPYSNHEFQLNYQPFSNRFRIWGDIRYVSPVLGRYEPQWSYSSGIQINLKSGLELLLESEKLFENLWSNAATDVVRLTLQQAIGFGAGQIRTFPYSDEENLSFISGTVYLDENSNGKMDRNEPGIAQIKMTLDGCEAVTDDSGVYMFSLVEPGIYQVNFNLRSLSVDYTPKTEEQLIKIKPSENMILDFGLTLNGSIMGKVFIDANSNGIMDRNETQLSWVGILLDDRKVYTSTTGEFYFENIPLGEHTIKIIPETLPKGMKVSGDTAYRILITKDALDVKNILYPIIFKFKE